MDKKVVSKRLREILQHFNISAAELTRLAGLPDNSKLSRLLNGHTYPSFETMQKILAAIPEINANWLITGKGNMILGQLQTNSSSGEECKECERKQSLIQEKERTIKILMKAAGMEDSFNVAKNQ